MDELVRRATLSGKLWSVWKIISSYHGMEITSRGEFLGHVVCDRGHQPFGPWLCEPKLLPPSVDILRQAMREEWGLAD